MSNNKVSRRQFLSYTLTAKRIGIIDEMAVHMKDASELADVIILQLLSMKLFA